MAINCDVILHWTATPDQLKALGAALWNWCNRTGGNTGIYPSLDNQALGDLIAGKLPLSSQAERWGVPFRIRDEVSSNKRVTLDSLRREIPARGVKDIVVDGQSWNLSD